MSFYDDSDSNPLYPVMYMSVPGTEDFQFVTSLDDGGGYDWTTWAAWYSPSKRQYFVASGSGCSCNDLSTDVRRLEDFETNSSKEELKRSLRAFCDDNFYDDKPNLMDEISAINSFSEGGS